MKELYSFNRKFVPTLTAFWPINSQAEERHGYLFGNEEAEADD